MTTWVKRWGYELEKTPVRPGVYRLKGGGFLLRARVAEPTTGKMVETQKIVRDVSLAQAVRERDEMQEKTRQSIEPESKKPLFSVFAVDVFEHKKAIGKIKSGAGKQKWNGILRNHLIEAFGLLRVDEITLEHLRAWQKSEAEKIAAGQLHPSTANTRIDVLRVVMGEAVSRYQLPRNPAAAIEKFSTAERPTYTEEQPNSLTAAESREFLSLAQKHYPQHFAMILLGFVTGLRPSHFRPLRYRGESPDVLWQTNEILVRRSHTTGKEAMNTTKTGRRQRIALPAEVMAVLRWHTRTQHVTPEQHRSDLLFPSEVGTIRFNSVLNGPFARILRKMGLKKKVTPRGMRRTFQDLCRAASVGDLVTRSVSGHATREMQEHYSTVDQAEQRSALERVVGLLKPAPAPSPAEGSGGGKSGG